MPADIESFMYEGDRNLVWHQPPADWRADGVTDLDWAMENIKPVRLARWGLEKQPVYQRVESVGLDPRTLQVVDRTTYEPIEGSHTVVRAGLDNASLGVVGDRYEVISNEEAFDPFRFLLDSGLATINTMGSLNGGRSVFMLLKLGVDPIEPVPGDITTPYVLVTTSHDGSGAVRIIPTAVRVVCANTLALAIKDGRGSGWTVRHTASFQRRLDQVQKGMKAVIGAYREYEEQAHTLARQSMTKAKWTDFLDELVPIPEDGRTGRAEAQQERLTQLFEAGTGQDLPGVSGTKWAALQAITEYTTWERSTRVKGASALDEATKIAAERENRFVSSTTGSGADLAQRALVLLTA